MNKLNIVLKREDLIKSKQNTPFIDITIYDFKRQVISIDEIRNANKITFIDGENVGVLKDRGLTQLKIN